MCGFTADKPVILVIGGSLGSVRVNEAVREILPELLKKYQVIHLCGKDKVDTSLEGTEGYVQYEYIQKELCDLLDAADLVISRAGANAICELLALKKPNLLIPLPASGSRGDQLLNAASFESQGYSIVINEDDLTTNLLVNRVKELFENRRQYAEVMSKSSQIDAIPKIIELIKEAAE